jgi:hypothetical protein
MQKYVNTTPVSLVSDTDPDKLTGPIRRQIKGATIECLVKKKR